MARKKSRRGLGYGCPCEWKGRGNAVCETAPLDRKGKRYGIVCKKGGKKVYSSSYNASRGERAHVTQRRRAKRLLGKSTRFLRG